MKPIACEFYTTVRCNAYCEFCRIWRDPQIQISEEAEVPYTREAMMTMMSDLRRLGVRYLSVTGGEPLLRDDLPVLLEAAKTRGLYVSLSTNGILLPEKIDQLAGKVDRLMLSIDSPIAEMHDRSRGIECFDLIETGIKESAKAGINLQLSFTVTKDSIQYLPEMDEFAQAHNLLVWLNPVYDFYGFEKLSGESIQHLKYYLKKKNFMGNLAAFQLLLSGGNHIAKPRCKAAQGVVTILPDMTLALPCFFSNQKRIEINGRLFEAWQSAERKKEESAQGRYGVCEGCMAWPYMLPSFWYRFDRLFLMNLFSGLDIMYKEYLIHGRP